MKSLRILIVEDNYSFANQLKSVLLSWKHQVVDIIEDSYDIIEKISSLKPDLILMDINISGPKNGIEIALAIKYNNIPIIFITGLRDEATFDAARLTNSIGYLVKPFDMLTLKGSIELAINYFQNTNEKTIPSAEAPITHFFIRKNKQLISIKISEIDWVVSDRNYCVLHVEGSRFAIKKSLKSILEQLPNDTFTQIHKSYIVRLDRIEGIYLTDNQIRIGKEMIPIGRSYRAEFLRMINRIE